jgi:hypothetical protein
MTRAALHCPPFSGLDANTRLPVFRGADFSGNAMVDAHFISIFKEAA